MTTNFDRKAVRAALLGRRGIMVISAGNERQSDAVMQALDVELAALGFALSMSLRERLRSVPAGPLAEVVNWLTATLAELRGANQNHEPLFRNFPEGVPEDTFALWVQRFIVHIAQRDGQPCLHCGEAGTTHVLQPCHHVVCDRCFDGSNYSGCPVCGNKVADSPFFKPSIPRSPFDEKVTLQVLHLREDIDAEARLLFESLCARTQALSPDDKAALIAVLADYRELALPWVPSEIPLRENVAQVFGTLFTSCPPERVLEHARMHITTATDVLRFIAAFSGADPSLQLQERYKAVPIAQAPPKILQALAKWFGGVIPPTYTTGYIPQKIARFKVAKLSRPLRRTLLQLLEEMPEQSLFEDMLRHQSFWVWVAEFLHPGEYADRYPKAHRGFQLVRKKGPDGTPAPPFETFYARVETAAAGVDVPSLVAILRERPGEFGRRLDHVLRLCGDEASRSLVLDSFEELAPQLATPMLVGMSAHFRKRGERAPVRIFWPKGGTVTGVSRGDDRALLAPAIVERLDHIIETELLRRFAAAPSTDTWMIDRKLDDIIVPFNERTASSSAVSLTRGSSVDVPEGKIARLFLHWCDPEGSGGWTDLDLSVGFYDPKWEYAGVCSYYQLKFDDVAKSSGDFTSAPFPEGATEFVDIDREAAMEHNLRYAVMVVNAYSGLPFNALERAFAGLMLRDSDQGPHFDPRTVELKFQLAGANGVFLPLVFDLMLNKLHWLDTYSRGELAFNNVDTSNKAITRLCPEAIDYFAFGSRPTMYELGLLHAAARGQRVILRGDESRSFDRGPDESPAEFLRRLRASEGGEPGAMPGAAPVTAMLAHGDIALPPKSRIYTLFPEQLSPNLAAADFLVD